MNAERRKKIEAVKSELQKQRDVLEDIQSDEQSAYDNLPDGLREGEAGDKMQNAIDELQTAIDGIDAVCDDNLDSATME